MDDPARSQPRQRRPRMSCSVPADLAADIRAQAKRENRAISRVFEDVARAGIAALRGAAPAPLTP